MPISVQQSDTMSGGLYKSVFLCVSSDMWKNFQRYVILNQFLYGFLHAYFKNVFNNGSCHIVHKIVNCSRFTITIFHVHSPLVLCSPKRNGIILVYYHPVEGLVVLVCSSGLWWVAAFYFSFLLAYLRVVAASVMPYFSRYFLTVRQNVADFSPSSFIIIFGVVFPFCQSL